MWTNRINDASNSLFLLLSQFNISRCPVFLQPLCLTRARDGDHTLSCNPRKRNLGYGTTFLDGQLFDLFNDCFVFVEIFSLELWNYLPIKKIFSSCYSMINTQEKKERVTYSYDGNHQAQNRQEIRG